jgi:hypothetical protein
MAKPAGEVKVSKDNSDRDARLAQALRENLRRRKAQARAGETVQTTDRHPRESGDPAALNPEKGE